jgi:riboflavin synthase
VFTGLVQDVGRIERVVPGGMTELWISTTLGRDEAYVVGESIAVDGACLTVVEGTRDAFRVQAAPETLRRTTLGGYAPGTRVNLERALKVGDRLGGHLVQGHVDAVAAIRSKRPEGGSIVVSFELPAELQPFFIEKGSVCIDGISLTVNTIGKDSFEVQLIPETQERTTLALKGPGDRVNLEADLIGKYVARLHGLRQGGQGLTAEARALAGVGTR